MSSRTWFASWLVLGLLAPVVPSAQVAPVPEAASNPPASIHGRTRNVAVLVFDGVELLDFTGPIEVFSKANGWDPAFRVYTVAPERAPVRTSDFVTVLPDYAASDFPAPDVLVIPGGETRPLGGDEPLARLVRESVPHTEIVFSVCNGVFCLAEAGFLDGLEATTFQSFTGWLRDAAPKATVRTGVRFVDNGRIVTAAGVSAGIDGALHLIHRLLGPEAARRAAVRMEYDWSEAPAADEPPPEDPFVRARQAWYAGDWKAAEADYAVLAAADAQDAIAWARWGTCLCFLRDEPAALEALHHAAELGLQDARLYDALGLALERSEQRDEAIEAWKRSLELDPDAVGPCFQLGSALYRAGRFEEAIPRLERAWKGYAGGSETGLMLAHAKLETNDRAGALSALDALVRTGAGELAAKLAEARFGPLREEERFRELIARTRESANR